MIKMKPLKTAVLGCGAISDAYITSIQNKFKILDLAVCANRTFSKAEEKAEKYGLKAVATEDILRDGSVELVINLTPSSEHYQTTKMLLEAGKHVYSEKVLALTFHEAEELVKLADQKGLYLGVAPDTFLGSAIQTARSVVETGMIGEVTSCYAALTRDYQLFAEQNLRAVAPGWGIAVDVGIYYLTALLSILGPVESVAGHMRKYKETGIYSGVEHLGETYPIQCETIGAGILQFCSGASGTILFDSNSIMNWPEKPALVMHGTQGICYMADPNQFGGEVRVIRKGQTEATIVPSVHPFDTESRGVGAAEMGWAIRRNRAHRANKEMALHAVEILHGLDVSGKRKTWYDMNTSFEKKPALPKGFRQYTPMINQEENAIAAAFSIP